MKSQNGPQLVFIHHVYAPKQKIVVHKVEKETSFQLVGECLYRYLPNNRYYARIEIGGKEIRRSLKTTDRKHAERKLRDLRSGLERTDAHMGKTTVQPSSE